MLEDGEGFGAKFKETGAEGFEVFVVFAVPAIAESFGGFKARFNVDFGDVQ